jgi:imidazolonepropionase
VCRKQGSKDPHDEERIAKGGEVTDGGVGSAGLAILGCSQVVTMSGPGAGEESLGIIEGGGVLVLNGTVAAAGPSKEIEKRVPSGCEVIDAGGAVLTPGLIDPHTHVVFAGSRELEFELRLKGASYSEIAKAGGGIRSSVRAFRKASTEELKEAALKRLNALLSYGVTTAEVKSGYGLSTADEIRTLEIVKELDAESPVELVPTFLGAHEVPDEYQSDRGAYIDLVVSEMIPEVAGRGLAKFCDVFCEEHVFGLEESRRILEAGSAAGLKPKLHADELTPLGGAELAAEVGAVSADHLTMTSPQGMRAMKDAGVVPVLLPGTSFFLASKYADARKMLDIGLPVALATDINPGSCTADSLPMIMTIACLNMKMLPFEALRAVTVNAARAIGMEGSIGVIAPGAQADMVLFEAKHYQYIVYHFGSSDVKMAFKRGRLVLDRR